MSFIWPAMLIWLSLVPLLVLFYVRMQQRRRLLAASFGNLGLVQASTARRLDARRHIPPALYLAGLTILLVALARPQAVVSLPRIEGTIILAFDASGSMAAEDLKPTRMEAAKAAARAFVERQPSTVRIGVVAFSDNGFATQAPTNAQEAIIAAIDRLTPQRGTSLGHGIQAALDAIAVDSGQAPARGTDGTATPLPTPTPVPPGTYAPAAIVMLSDGENTAASDPITVAQAAADRGVRIHTVGIGSAEGIRLTINDFTVHTRLDEPTLRQVAERTGGAYFNAQNEQDLRAIYEQLDTQLVVKPEATEVTSLLAGAGILLLLLGGTYSLLWFSRLP